MKYSQSERKFLKDSKKGHSEDIRTSKQKENLPFKDYGEYMRPDRTKISVYEEEGNPDDNGIFMTLYIVEEVEPSLERYETYFKSKKNAIAYGNKLALEKK